MPELASLDLRKLDHPPNLYRYAGTSVFIPEPLTTADHWLLQDRFAIGPWSFLEFQEITVPCCILGTLNTARDVVATQ